VGGNKIDENLFELEEEVVRSALTDVKDERYRNNELLSNYQLLVAHYQKLLKSTRKIFRISDSQGLVLQRHQNEIQNLLNNANQGFLTFGRDLRVDQQYSDECVRIFGKKIAGLPINELLHQGSGDVLPEMLQEVFASQGNELQAALRQISTVLRINDRDVHVECKLISQPNDSAESTLIMMILTDVTEKLRAEEQIRYLSYHDKLTSLFNRAYAEMVLLELGKPETLPLSIIMIDLNALKLANDVFGHEQGDRILIAISMVLTKSCRQTDIIARWGGDEFLVLLPKTSADECFKVCERIRQACNEVVDGPIPLSAAIGMATKNSAVVRITEIFNTAEKRMYKDKMLRSREVRRSIIASVERMLYDRRVENEGHRDRIQKLSAQFAAFWGIELNALEMRLLSQLASLHDIGKVAISKEILDKAGPLTPDEWDIVKSHSELGYRMAQSIGEQSLADNILAIHERWDGAGYPFGLKGDQIPFLVRLFSIVDVYDVMTHERPYRETKNKQTALCEIESGCNGQFDPALAAQFAKFMRQKQ